MKIVKSELTPIGNYIGNYEIQMDKPVDFKLLEEFCNIKEADMYIDLEFYDDDDEFELDWDSTKEPFIQDFLDKCKESNIYIKDPLYWDLLISIDGEDVNIGYEGKDNIIYLNMEGSMKTIEKVLSIIEKIDKKGNVIKVVK